MPVIQPHDITLYGGNGEFDIVLRPLADEHLPLLYKWMADPDVTYFTESAVGLRYTEDTVRRKYGGMSRTALCFAVEANGATVGECWLQPMNRADVRAMYPDGTDVRRIDMSIGEKEYWNRGIGSAFIRMLVRYAFEGEHVDALHCFCEDYNTRSERMWRKNGFAFMKKEPTSPDCVGEFQLHYALTRRAYIENQRAHIPQERTFPLPVPALHPSKLCLSAGKLRLCREWFAQGNTIDPIPVRRFMDRWLILDGHARAVLALQNGIRALPCYIDCGDRDMAAYAEDLDACMAAEVTSVAALAERTVSPRDYEVLCRKRRMERHARLSYIYMKQGEEALFWTERAVPEEARNIRAIGRDALELYNHHMALCGQKPVAAMDTDCFLLFEDGAPVARAGIEKIGEMLWEVSDVRVARPWRHRGFGRAICAHVLNRIIASGHIATCRTMPDNAGMNAIITSLGFQPLYERKDGQ
jgi:aminoglycoside 6'-N-acetyltransferase